MPFEQSESEVNRLLKDKAKVAGTGPMAASKDSAPLSQLLRFVSRPSKQKSDRQASTGLEFSLEKGERALLAIMYAPEEKGYLMLALYLPPQANKRRLIWHNFTAWQLVYLAEFLP